MLLLFVCVYCLQVFTVCVRLLFTCLYCLHVSTICIRLLFACVNCLYASTVYMCLLFVYCLHVSAALEGAHVRADAEEGARLCYQEDGVRRSVPLPSYW